MAVQTQCHSEEQHCGASPPSALMGSVNGPWHEVRVKLRAAQMEQIQAPLLLSIAQPSIAEEEQVVMKISQS